MIKDLKFEAFKNGMDTTTKKLLKEHSDFEGHDALTLNVHDHIDMHLQHIGFEQDKDGKDTDTEIDVYNLAYKEIERLYINHLKSL